MRAVKHRLFTKRMNGSPRRPNSLTRKRACWSSKRTSKHSRGPLNVPSMRARRRSTLIEINWPNPKSNWSSTGSWCNRPSRKQRTIGRKSCGCKAASEYDVFNKVFQALQRCDGRVTDDVTELLQKNVNLRAHYERILKEQWDSFIKEMGQLEEKVSQEKDVALGR